DRAPDAGRRVRQADRPGAGRVSAAATPVPAPDAPVAAADRVSSRPERAGASVVAALVGRDLRRFFRQRSRIVGSLAQPLILWAVLGGGLGASFHVAAPAPAS